MSLNNQEWYRPYSEPWRASIWDWIGHSGSLCDGFAVNDGVIYNQTLNLVNRPLTRDWPYNSSRLVAWDGMEMITSLIQTGRINFIFNLCFAGFHFLVHLGGGYNADMAHTTAPME